METLKTRAPPCQVTFKCPPPPPRVKGSKRLKLGLYDVICLTLCHVFTPDKGSAYFWGLKCLIFSFLGVWERHSYLMDLKFFFRAAMVIKFIFGGLIKRSSKPLIKSHRILKCKNIGEQLLSCEEEYFQHQRDIRYTAVFIHKFDKQWRKMNENRSTRPYHSSHNS